MTEPEQRTLSGGITMIMGFPPNIEKIRNAFGELPPNVVFAYGEIIFNPSGMPIPEPCRIHELTHMAQQGADVEGWWDNYINSKKFRFDQELEAFSNEYNCYRTHQKDRNKAAVFLHSCAKRLSSELYGSLVTHSEAITLLRNHADQGYSKKR